MSQRERFEAYATAPERQWSVELQAHNGVEPGAYRALETQAAWLAWQEAERQTVERCMWICDELEEHYSGYKDTALLNGDVALSNAASGEPRACRSIKDAIRAIGGDQC